MRGDPDLDPVTARNIFDHPPTVGDEVTDALLAGDEFRVDRIVSRGHRSPPDFWYDQTEHEWVLVLAGRARLRFEQDDRVVALEAGDHVNIPAHARHRVEWTDPERDTVWLALFYR